MKPYFSEWLVRQYLSWVGLISLLLALIALQVLR